ncbi:hypothetical protein [Amycolatopsis orientalis]|uniref:hypothetical protein n=1 Tax=Amycolatopsis orientalis TaxID=31958 RepID=UPI00039E739F|nr:hypothetical protein [Amycolatopsis orientalis]
MGTTYTPQQIVDLVKHGSGSGGMFAGGGVSSQLSALHQDIANHMRELQGSMSEYWQGDAAGQAYTGAGPLVQASQVSGEHLQEAQSLYQGQGESFNTLHAKIQSVGDVGEKPADDWVSGTPFSFLSNRQDQIDEWKRKAEAVTESYNAYHQQSTENSARWADPSQYGQLALPSAGGDFTVTQPGGTGNAHLPAHYTPGGPGGTAGTYSEGGYVGDHTGTTSSTGGTGGHRDHTDDRTGPPGTLPPSETHRWDPERYAPPPGNPPESGRHVTPPQVDVPDDTRTSSYVPPDLTSVSNPTTTSSNPNSWSVNNPNPTGGLFSPGFPGIGGGNAGGPGSSGGPGSGNAGNPGNAGNSVGRGGGTGTGPFGSGEAAARGGAAANGRAGAPGMGAMGHGQKGEEEEDLVHETADYLVEQDPDGALIGDLPKAVPPVIGL